MTSNNASLSNPCPATGSAALAGVCRSEAEAPQPPHEPGTSSRAGLTVLVAEDEPAIRNLVGALLERQGFTVLRAADGLDALEVCVEHPGPIHLLVTDVNMPRLSGPRLVVEALIGRPSLAVLYMSGRSEGPICGLDVGSGADDLLLKPFTAAALMDKVKELLERHHLAFLLER